MNRKDYLFVYGTLRKGYDPNPKKKIVNNLQFVGKAKIGGSLYDLGDYPGAVKNKPAAVKNKPGAVKSKPGAVKNKPGAVKNKPGAMKNKAGAVKDKGTVKDKPGAAKNKEGNEIIGDVFLLDDPDKVLKILDKYEGYSEDKIKGSEFVRKKSRVRLNNGKNINAWIYWYNYKPQDKPRIKNKDYLTYLKNKKPSKNTYAAL